MKILAVDSSAGVAAVALTENGKVLADYTLNSGNTSVFLFFLQGRVPSPD